MALPRTTLGRGAGRGTVSRKFGRETQARIAPIHVAKPERTYTNWREKRAELRQGLRAARQYRAERAYSHYAPNHDPSSRMRLGGARAAANVGGFGVGVAYGSSPRDAVYKTKPLRSPAPSPALALLQELSALKAAANAERRLTKGVCFGINSAGRVGMASGLEGRASTLGRGKVKDQLVRRKKVSSVCGCQGVRRLCRVGERGNLVSKSGMAAGAGAAMGRRERALAYQHVCRAPQEQKTVHACMHASMLAPDAN